ncbi:UDP-N-acetylmuramoyl-L-alanine--D-glutamate ligase [Marinagarivorans algicola]|uniref:UDP-N-acetylmuramoyl-L-alanine--D-glutamate ligase n=1 Tax=Marinagarivorans algicola TaxID=1513270 RepID=UPI0006B5EE98|nr:UDP-N-acetylmuramoyl-L-alanine--D-glutamate ligase [Marinagarivorans algicola]
MSLIATNKYTLVVGLGLSGVSAARYLLAQGVNVVACDTRKNPPNIVQVKQDLPCLAIELGALDEELFVHAQEIIISPGMSRKTAVIQKALAAGVPVIGDVELFARAVQAPVIAITGSNGKSTVTTLVGEMAKAANISVQVAGNIGLPVLQALSSDVELYVLELSSFQLESTSSLKPVVATILNVSADHMDRYESFIEYALTKQRVAFGAKTVVFNKQDPLTEPPIADGVKRVCFTAGEPDLKEYGFSEGHLVRGFNKLVAASKLKIAGKHNMMNACAALAIAEAADIPIESCLAALKQFAGLAHRCERIIYSAGIDYINDSKATNVGAAVAALEGLANQKNIHIILGGDGKGADFSPLLPALQAYAKSVVVIGKDGDTIKTLIHHNIATLCVSSANTLPEAVKLAHAQARDGDVVLLSPACASLDMFKNFEQRGEIFAQVVRDIVS